MKRETEDDRRTEVESGPGALCAEAQADGVPCTDVGRDCDQCAQAVRRVRPPKAADVDPC